MSGRLLLLGLCLDLLDYSSQESWGDPADSLFHLYLLQGKRSQDYAEERLFPVCDDIFSLLECKCCRLNIHYLQLGYYPRCHEKRRRLTREPSQVWSEIENQSMPIVSGIL